MKNLLLIIYKIEDKKGSEDGCGFEIALRAMQEHNVTIITRPNNIELLKNDKRFDKAKLVSVEVPKWLGWFKNKNRGIILFYYLWHIFVGKKIKSLLTKQQFDTIHLVNFHTDWCPHFIPSGNQKIVWGPVVHHSNTPANFIYAGSKIKKYFEIFKEYLRRLGKFYFWRVDPFMRPCIKRSDVIIYGNGHYAPPFKKHAKFIEAFPYGGSIFKGDGTKPHDNEFRLLFVGRLVNLKGTIPALMAFKKFVDAKPDDGVNPSFSYVGGGELKTLLQAKIADYNLQDKVNLIGHIEQQKLKEYYANAHGFLFPSFESQGLVVSEAMSYATPVITIKGHGPDFIAGDTSINVPHNNPEQASDLLAEQLLELYDKYKNGGYDELVNKVYKRYEQHLNWDAIYSKIAKHY